MGHALTSCLLKHSKHQATNGPLHVFLNFSRTMTWNPLFLSQGKRADSWYPGVWEAKRPEEAGVPDAEEEVEDYGGGDA